MSNLADISRRLKSQGHRFSAARSFILRALDKSRTPLSATDLQKLFKKHKLSADRTTLYRELKLLTKQGIIMDLRLKDGKRWYELARAEHRHHIVCLKCDKINELAGCDPGLVDKTLKRSSDFARIQSHSLVFFGLCKLCAKKYPAMSSGQES